MRDAGTRVTREQLDDYLAGLAQKGCRKSTLESYRRDLHFFYSSLSDGRLPEGGLDRWRDALLEEGYKPSTVNHRLSSVNGFLAYLGLWQFRARQTELPKDSAQPELSRGEYLRLLSAARAQGKERTYLLVKVFACTGIAVHQLPGLTVESLPEWDFPACLREELLRFARQAGVQRGPVFVTRTGKALSRTNITGYIQQLAQDARVAPEKCNPRCLQRLYRTTQEDIQQNVAQLVREAYARLLETEQLAIGWESAGP